MGTKYITSSNNTYKVYTALLTQNGGDDPFPQTSGDLVIGYTYEITDNLASDGWDFTNVGAPNNNVGTFFVATGITPNSWEDGYLLTNSSAPSVTVLENTLGNIWFTYVDIGVYGVYSSDLFTLDKTALFIGSSFYGDPYGTNFTFFRYNDINQLFIATKDGALSDADDYLYKTPIEIRVYN